MLEVLCNQLGRALPAVSDEPRGPSRRRDEIAVGPGDIWGVSVRLEHPTYEVLALICSIAQSVGREMAARQGQVVCLEGTSSEQQRPNSVTTRHTRTESS